MAPKGSFRKKQQLLEKNKAAKTEVANAEAAAKAEAEEAERQEKVNELKDAGNTAFSAHQWLLALEKFTEAIKFDPSGHVLYSNRSATNLQLLRTADAVRDAQECVRLSPSWPKGYSRLGAALLADKQAGAAVAAYEKGLLLDSSNVTLQEGLEIAKPSAQAEKDEKERERKEKEAEAAKDAAASSPEAQARSLEDTTVIGIDLGTTYSCVAVWQHGQVEILEDDQGNKTTPSFVAFTADGGRLVGETAKMQAAKNPINTLYDVKRIIGQKMNEHDVKEEVKRFPFPVVADAATNDPRIVVDALGGKEMPAEQISALVLGHLKRVAETRLGHSVRKAVITVPAYFNDAQRSATKAAGAIAGLEVLRIINEPTAAALAYGLDNKDDGSIEGGCNVLIYDLGGGTFDVSILRIEGGMFNVKATGGDTHLGGEDFDNVVVDHLSAELKKRHQLDITGDAKLTRRLRNAAERAKRQLSSSTQAQVEIEDHCLELSRAKFEALNKAPFDRTLDTVKAVLKDAKMNPSDIDDIVLVGGSTRIPKLRDMLSEFFGGRELCRSINPDEAVAYGAAVQGAILSGVRHAATDSLLLVDVTPLSLGIECEGKHFSVLIPRNTPIPCKKCDTYTTTEDYQESIDVPVYEGERPCTDGNRKLGEFTIHNIERAKREEPKVEVTFSLDANGILEVTARDKKTGAKADCRIEGACKGLDPAEITRLVNEAEQFAAEDAEYRVQSELRTELEGLAYDIQDKAEAAAEKSGKEGMASTASRRAEECIEWLEDLEKLGKPETRRALEKWIKELQALA